MDNDNTSAAIHLFEWLLLTWKDNALCDEC